VGSSIDEDVFAVHQRCRLQIEHGMITTQADVINADLLAFIKR